MGLEGFFDHERVDKAFSISFATLVHPMELTSGIFLRFQWILTEEHIKALLFLQHVIF